MAPDRHDPPKKSRRAKKGARQLPTLAEFLVEAEVLVAQARAMLERDKAHGPILFCFGPTGLTHIVAIKGESSRPMHQIVRAAVRKTKAQAFIFVDESWMVAGTPGDPGLLRVPPSRHPERRECLTVFAVHPEGRTAWTIPFAREGGTITFGQVKQMSGANVGGGLAEALGEEGRP